MKRYELFRLKNIVDDTVRDIVNRAVEEKGLKEAMAGPVWMNEEKRIPIKKVRYYASVTNPLNIRMQRDVSAKEYKQQYHVANDSNYMLAMYIGKDKKGKEKRDFEIVNVLQAAQYFKMSNDKEVSGYNIVPVKSRHGYPFAYSLKIGTMVLLYEKSPAEVWEDTIAGLNKRLYKVTGFWFDGRLVVTKHTEARPSSEIAVESKSFSIGNAKGRYSYSKLTALVQGYDFEVNEIGEIKRLR